MAHRAPDGRHLMDLFAWELAELVRSGAVTPEQCVSASLERIRERDPRLNAFCFVDWEGAAQRAAALTRRLRSGDKAALGLPLCGVPIGVKDLEDVAGMPTGHGVELYARRQRPAQSHSVQVARLVSAGCIVVGKLNTAPLGYIAITKTIPFGSTANPWDLSRSPGGSSGGSGSAVAGGLVPLATSSDGGGSIRIPAALCGVFGLKPSRGRIPTLPGLGMEPWVPLTVVGPTARCVRDAALYLDAAAGPHGESPWSLPPPGVGYAESCGAPCGRLRIAASRDLGVVERVRSSIAAHFDTVLSRAAGDGHSVRVLSSAELTLPDFGDDWTRNGQAQSYAALVTGEPELRDGANRHLLDRGLTRGWDAIAKSWGVLDLAKLQRRIADNNARLARVFEHHDLLLTPALPDHAWPVRGPLPGEIEGHKLSSLNQHALFLMPFNYSGHPAAVIAMGRTSERLPCAFQVVADRHRDDLLLRFCSEWEAKYKPVVLPEWPFAGPPAPRGPRSPRL
eukprot:TRINITY_DN51894_c0_g1_i1.p1 TRINITY_DN51894_c0_g1~~TRINITY_DN51894_c0_g1_i1.p1  ORF type:complete len:534 (+),score=137.14 TRINITY_DN51894_c0_g1_i1:79-1602(+)